MTAKDFHVGQTIYIGSIVRTDLNGGLNLATVTSIRRKWITFTYLFDGYSKGPVSYTHLTLPTNSLV